MKSFLRSVRTFLTSQDGPTAVEYAVMLALIVVASLTVISSVGSNASGAFNKVANSMGS
jgi:pilus assembly protein Flp/PilA